MKFHHQSFTPSWCLRGERTLQHCPSGLRSQGESLHQSALIDAIAREINLQVFIATYRREKAEMRACQLISTFPTCLIVLINTYEFICQGLPK